MAGLDAEEAPLERLRAEEEEEIGGEVRGIADIGESFEGTNIDERLISIGMELVAKIHQDEHDDIPFSCFGMYSVVSSSSGGKLKMEKSCDGTVS